MISHNGFPVAGQRVRYLIGVGDIGQIAGVARDAKVRVRMRSEELALAYVRQGDTTSSHYLVLNNEGQIALGPAKAVNLKYKL